MDEALPIRSMEAEVAAAAQAVTALVSAVLTNGVAVSGTTLGMPWTIHIKIQQVAI